MAERIIQSLRALASKIEILGERADDIINDDKELATDFRKLLKVIPATWKKESENRLFSQVKKNKEAAVIQESHRQVIWSWKDSYEIFCSRRTTNIVNPNDTLVLDGLISGIKEDDTELVLSSIHWRLSLLVIYFVKVQVCENTNSAEEIATYFLTNGLVSSHQFNYLVDNVLKWVQAGANYEDLSRNIGGYGSLVFLPDIGRSNYESYYHPTKESGYAVVGALTSSVAPVAAQKFEGLNSHDVVTIIVNTTMEKIKDVRLFIIPAQSAGMRRTTRVKRRRPMNKSAQTRKRPSENNQNTPGSKVHRVDLRRTDTAAVSPPIYMGAVHESSAETEESPDSSVSAIGGPVGINDSTSGFETSSEQAASVLFNIRNQGAYTQTSHSLPQSFEALVQPAEQFQRSGTIQSFALYDQIPIMVEPQPEHQLNASNSTQIQPSSSDMATPFWRTSGNPSDVVDFPAYPQFTPSNSTLPELDTVAPVDTANYLSYPSYLTEPIDTIHLPSYTQFMVSPSAILQNMDHMSSDTDSLQIHSL